MRSTKFAASAMAIGVLALGTTVVGQTAAQASSQTFTTYSQINHTGLQDPVANGSDTVAMTVSPANAAPGSGIEINITGTIEMPNGPASPIATGAAELSAVVTLDGTDYLLRGSRNDQVVGLDQTVFNSGWKISSSPGASSSSSTNTAGGSGWTAGTVNGTGGVGTALRSAPTDLVALKAPDTTGSYTIGLKAIIVNSIAGSMSPALTDNFDSITNTDPVQPGAGVGAKLNTGSFATNDTDGTTPTKGNFVFDDPVVLQVTDDGASEPPVTGTQEPTTSTPTSTSTSTPTTSTPAPAGTPRTDSATIPNINCGVDPNVAPDADKYTNWPAKLTVKPGEATSGDDVEVTVEVTGSALNTGPTDITPGSVRFEAVVLVGDEEVTIKGPTNKTTVPMGFGMPKADQKPVFSASEMPLVAKGSFTAGGGKFPVKIKTFIYNGLTDQANNNTFDVKCNAGNPPWSSPKAFAAPSVQLDVSGEPRPINSGGPSDGDDDVPGDGDGDGTGGTGALAETGPKETLIVGLAALLALQLGMILTVRAVRARPVRRH